MSFKSLVSAVSEQCQEIKQALKLFPYFETWDENVIAECCRLSSVIEFSPDDIIICDSKSGNSHVVYFVLNGVCKMIHHLRARVKTDSYGRTTYKLYSTMGSRSSKADSNTVGFTSLLLTENYDFAKKVTTEEAEIERPESVEERVQSPVPSSPVKDEVTRECENQKEGDEEEEEEQGDEDNGQEEEEEGEETLPNTGIMADSNDHDDGTVPKEHEEEEGGEESEVGSTESPKVVHGESEDEKEAGEEEVEEASMDPSVGQPSDKPEGEEEEEDKCGEPKREIVYEPDHHIKVLEECRNKARQTIRVAEDGQESDIPEDVKSFFVQVGLFYKGACFGLETNAKGRIVMSATKVKCLRIPRQFLLQHNPSNIWNRIRLFLDLYLPREDKILEYFVQDRKWAHDKRKEAEMIAFSNGIFNYTLTAHVPYSIRLLEDVPTTHDINHVSNGRRVQKETRKRDKGK